MENLISIRNLNYGFTRDKLILKNIDLSVPKGSIFGFLGANGAGKSTTMKMLIGSIPDDQNSIQIFEKDLSDLYPEGFQKIGSLIDTAAFYDHLSGWDNLVIISRLRNLPGSECERVLHLVGLWESRKMKMKKYSLGMKQRLSIAMTLLGKPDLLILDEPVNGLDPNGMLEMRELLIKLNKEEGVTIFISSHLLQEIEKMITHLAIISHGEIRFTGSIQDLNELYRYNHIRIGIINATRFIDEVPENYSPKIINDHTIEITAESKENIAALIKKLVLAQAEIFEVKNNAGLEDWFMEITKN
ncbi:ABC transporter ATP-binding protein [Chryseobacterium indologenes]|uniref:ABC transporter ATP-binding protein n=1 Tax=Chryseobacterium indologenes TaxID=253 RepID=UPI0004B122E1|nr:ABC transporter ATP-binding protein [Chryseobacterium indologenes]QPQ52332.1 ABC transporter ATP-binding protein [Chryseobacterium indologenes]SFJ88517.1 ABC-2 type transport system ATP-binding protein [Chryseobacterium indologenes]SUX50954.1 Fluoroquinolones export ATP-binding protein Rv2688c/MT2762 [Chryseobacterium indologenes]